MIFFTSSLSELNFFYGVKAGQYICSNIFGKDLECRCVVYFNRELVRSDVWKAARDVCFEIKYIGPNASFDGVAVHDFSSHLHCPKSGAYIREIPRSVYGSKSPGQ